MRTMLERWCEALALPDDRLVYVESAISHWSSARQAQHIVLATELNCRAIEKLIAGEGSPNPQR
ncbi:MAG: hypothetical protein AAF488_08060 [Planctomycetota bacterium]